MRSIKFLVLVNGDIQSWWRCYSLSVNLSSDFLFLYVLTDYCESRKIQGNNENSTLHCFMSYCAIVSKLFKSFVKSVRNCVNARLCLIRPHKSTYTCRLPSYACVIRPPYNRYAQMCPCRMDHPSQSCKRDLNRSVEEHFRILLTVNINNWGNVTDSSLFGLEWSMVPLHFPIAFCLLHSQLTNGFGWDTE